MFEKYFMIQINRHVLWNSKKVFFEKILEPSLQRKIAFSPFGSPLIDSIAYRMEFGMKKNAYMQWMNIQDTLLYTIHDCDGSIACFALLSRPNFLTNPYDLKLNTIFPSNLNYENIDLDSYQKEDQTFDRTKYTKYYQLKYLETSIEHRNKYYAMNMLLHFQSHENVIIRNEHPIMKLIYEKCRYKHIAPDLYMSNYNSGKYKHDD